MRLRRRHYSILRALDAGPLTTDALACAVGTSPTVADLRATELLPRYLTSREDVWTITAAGRAQLATPERAA